MGSWKKAFDLLLVVLALWLVAKYLLPILLPFVAGLLLAFGAEPFVSLAQNKFRFRREIATGIGVSLTLVLLTGFLALLGAFAVKELHQLVNRLPDVGQTVQQGLHTLENVLDNIAQKAPAGIRPMLTGSVHRLFQDGSVLTEQVTQKVPAAISSLLGWVPDGALGLGTALLSAFMLSVRLPRIRLWFSQQLARSPLQEYLPGLKRCHTALGGWLKAQLKLSFLTFCIVGAGFLLLGIPGSFGWAAVVALVDAVPVLGTGTVLVPWALVCLLRQAHLRAIGLLIIYAVALVSRTALEPRLVGRHLGLDPLVTLLSLYLGYQFWGVPGMILAPLIATAAKTFSNPRKA